VFNLIVILLSISLTMQAQEKTSQATNLDTPQDAVPGPYPVGRTWFSVNQGTENPLILVAWYPATKQDGNQDVGKLTVPDEYIFDNSKLLEDSGNWGSAVLNATPETSTAPYPLIIFSDGYNTTPREYTNIEEHIVSYGFVVLSALYPVKKYGPVTSFGLC
jgi:predicted dienelactone hydrolase